MDSFLGKLGRDRTFWLIVGGILVVYLILAGGAMLPFLLTMIALVLAITVHECAHAWVADRLGDPTARLMGRVSLNPLVHLDPVGSIMMVITALTGLGIGWGKPVPVSPHRLRYGPRLGNGLVALAGPASNLLLAVCFGVLLRLGSGLLLSLSYASYVYYLVTIVVLTNVAIAIFNLLPFPPLDGYSVLIGLLSLSKGEWAWKLTQYLVKLGQYGSMILIGLIILSQFMGLDLLGRLIGPPIYSLYRLFLGVPAG